MIGQRDRTNTRSVSEQIESTIPYRISGSVTRLAGLSASVASFPAPMGATCRIHRGPHSPVDCEVIGFNGSETLVMPYGDLTGISRGAEVEMIRSQQSTRAGYELLGRVLDAQGNAIDGWLGDAVGQTFNNSFARVSLDAAPTPPLSRPPIDELLDTGIRAIDGLLTCGKGQRLGLFAGSGVGKSVLLGHIARSSSADVNIIVLVGERGREVREFVERNLGSDGLSKSIVVAATSDESPLLRIRAAKLGTALAEFFRDQGADVLLLMDSVTRFAVAQREIGLAAGEPPATRGYPPSVFSILPRLLERSGRNHAGSITGFYTVLVEGDDTNEPIADTVRGILDGHIVLSRQLAAAGHWPAIDVSNSISRVMPQVTNPEHLESARQVRRLIAAYEAARDLISIGAYQAGSSDSTDEAIALHERIDDFVQQGEMESTALSATLRQLQDLKAA
ncbi:MAG: EscN/YscN/HrcN family type III secretion system ATPase [Planctomycetaceae bacterium]|nr:EscN/YscN/HrcN family type III secretion system ATPase [Planctomycetaceae bacterium]